MNRIIVHSHHKDYNNIVGTCHTEDYCYNHELKCIKVDNETLCFIKLKYQLNDIDFDIYSDMPTYAIISTTDSDHIVI